ncbi:class I SAM-dependent methyltransferase [Candidatus Dependentiae bacterium]|nr:class I SAM-dependent methyltransferase [Candidatus Dependentiae bacterium]MCC7414884.1 class I SAM-dependent methyltransferase [Campylobacterota bacterium]
MEHCKPLYGNLASLYYDIREEYAPGDEVAFYARFIQPGQQVLEAMSGSGRLQLPLLQAGCQVIGVDNSPHMLARCRQRAAQLKLSPILHEQSLEQLDLGAKYHLCIIAMGSFQLIADRKSALYALQNIRAHLYNGGTLLLDIFTPHDTGDVTPAVTVACINAHEYIRCTTRYFFYAAEHRVDALCSYEYVIDGQLHEREYELMQFRWYDGQELTQLLDEAGFDFVRVHEQSFRSAGLSQIVQAQARAMHH